MEAVFGSVDVDQYRTIIRGERWDELPISECANHLATCSDCPTSLWQFLQIRHLVDYRSQRCFHVAYYSADVPERCLDRHLGMYSIITNRETREGVVIGFCPWCGIGLPTGVR